jgi:hypothetical protein
MGVQLPQAEGNIRKVDMPDLKMDKDGKPTSESMDALKKKLSEKAGHGTAPSLTCKASDPKKVADYAKKVANDKDRPKYNWNPFSSNQCRDFAAAAVNAGQ